MTIDLTGIKEITEDIVLEACHGDKLSITEVVRSDEPGLIVGDHAFEGCENLTCFYFNRNFKEIGNYAFTGCKNYPQHNIDAWNEITAIGNYAFEGWTNDVFVLNSNIKKIGDYAFKDCVNLGIPHYITYVEYIGLNALIDTKTPINFNELYPESYNKLIKFTFNDLGIKYWNIDVYGDKDPFPGNCLTFTSNNVTPALVTSTREALSLEISDVYNVKFEAPDTVIAQNAFKDYTAISSMLGTENISKIEASAFYNCNHLTSAINAPNCIEIGIDAFNGCALLSTLNLPNCENVQTNALRGIGQLDEDGVRRYRLHSTYTPSES